MSVRHGVVEPEKRRYLLHVALGLCLIAFAACIQPVLRSAGFPLDDAWIHQVIGRNTAEFGIPGFVPGAASSGSTSAIWPWIIAGNYTIATALPPELYLYIVNSLCLVAIVMVLYTSARGDGLSIQSAAAITLLPIVTGNFVWLVSSGMEHLLFIAAIYAASCFWLRTSPVGSARNAIFAGLSCGLAILTRPEAIVFLPVFALAALVLRKSLRDMIVFAGVCILAIGLLLLDNLWTSHALLPVTFAGRKWLYFGPVPPSKIELDINLLHTWLRHIRTYFIGLDSDDDYVRRRIFEGVFVISSLLGLYRLIAAKAYRIGFLILLTFVNFLTYCLIMPSTGNAMRYQAMTTIWVFPLMALGLMEVTDGLTTRLSRSVAGACRFAILLCIGALACISLSNWSAITALGIQHIDGTHKRMGQWLTANLDPSTKVASFDIGAIGYFGKVQLVDLGGLTDPDFVPFLYENRVPDYLKARGVRWLVLPVTLAQTTPGHNEPCRDLTRALNLCDSPQLTKREVVSFFTPEKAWDAGYAATAHASQGQVLYELTWR